MVALVMQLGRPRRSHDPERTDPLPQAHEESQGVVTIITTVMLDQGRPDLGPLPRAGRPGAAIPDGPLMRPSHGKGVERGSALPLLSRGIVKSS